MIDPAFRQPLQTAVPVLLLSGDADPVTPPQYAEQVAGGLSNSRHIIISGMGHGLLTFGCMPDVVTQFIESGSNDDLDVSCLNNVQPGPFFVDFSGPKP